MKKMLRVLTCVVLMIVMLTASAMACHISRDPAMDKLYAKVASANARIEAVVQIAKATPYDDVAWMQARIAVIVADVQAYARSIGATVECHMEKRWIDGRWVMVDPLIVVNI